MKKIHAGLFMTLAFVAMFETKSSASEISNPSDTAVPVDIKFAGFVNNQPVFQLNFAGSAVQNEFVITIQDEMGTTLFRERTKGYLFSRNFQLNTDELGDQTLRFDVYCTQTRTSVTYDVNRHTRFVQDIAIQKRN